MQNTSWDESGIREMFERYTEIFERKDVRATVEFMHPKIFEMVPRSTVIMMLESVAEDDGANPRMKNLQIRRISELLEANAVTYGLVEYAYLFEMQENSYTDEELEEMSEEPVFDKITFIKSLLSLQYGKDKVRYDEVSQSFLIDIESSLYVIGDPKLGA